MLDKLLLTLSIGLYAVVVPYLEINDTHVFNPAWVAHAKLHEVWQLITNSSLGAVALWLTWFSQNGRAQASLIALLVTGGFLAAFAMQDLYGGSMVHSDGTEKTAFGMNVGVLGFGWVFLTSSFTLARSVSSEGNS
ncbi:hypothetical protein SAMN04487881_2492 [Marinobacter sp. es.048]|uniref:hypothetical protein n=1 Tax=Marinobacter sp. es.048 TaxID=1761795 RepID=UPI000B589360|nr:hypothetical protein [Marinobacter sp. es.048]SNC74659.1 hypothetical protein SAMN04487881_2492 [Marinobacter sp. es.048]